MWTPARLALIVVGDRATLSPNQLWKRALEAYTEVVIVLEVRRIKGVTYCCT
jgi:hypothetical protein